MAAVASSTAGTSAAPAPAWPTPAPARAWEPLDAARRAGIVEVVRDLLPSAADPIGIALTQLGDVWLLMVALALFVWFGAERRDGALALALALGALGLVVGLKALFALDRPRPDLWAYEVDGYGFPSGHALGSTVVWGALAWLGSFSTRERRLGAAAVVVAVVGLSRVVLGVHYLGSVLAGFVIGAGFLVMTLRISEREPLRAFAVAAVVAGFAVGVGLRTGDPHAVADGATVLGGVLGGALVWSRFDVEGRIDPAGAVAGLALFGGLWAVVETVEPAIAVLFVASAVVFGGILSWPALVGTARNRWRGRTGPSEERLEKAQ